MMPGRRFGAKHAVIPLDTVEVHLKNPLLGPEHFDQSGEPGFQAFAQPAAARPQEQVFRDLLAEGAGATDRTAALVMGKRRLNRADIEAPVLREFLVFAGNHRDFQVIGDLVPGFPGPLQVNGFAVKPGFDLALDHQRRPRWRHHAKDQHQQYAATHEPEHGLGEMTEIDTQHRDGLAEPVERAIIQTLWIETDWSSACCVAF
ncbi:hypothetical protein D3C85_1229340 [compost metagenome]